MNWLDPLSSLLPLVAAAGLAAWSLRLKRALTVQSASLKELRESEERYRLLFVP